MKLRVIASIGVLVSPLFWAHFACAYTLEEQQKALELITQTADRICKDIAQRGSDTQRAGSIEANLGLLTRALNAAGLSVSGRIANDEYQGVLREDLTAAIKGNQDCKLTVLKQLVEVLLPHVEPAKIVTAKTDEVKSLAASPFAQLVGKWNNDATGENVIIEANGDVLDTRIGLGRIAATTEEGANYAISYPKGKRCLAYVSFTNDATRMNLAPRGQPKGCLNGVFNRVSAQ